MSRSSEGRTNPFRLLYDKLQEGKHLTKEELDLRATTNQYTILHDLFSVSPARELYLPTLLTYGADPNSLNQLGDTPLHLASEFGSKEAVKLLLEKGANPNTKNLFGDTPLHYAFGCQNKEAVKLLLENGADPNIQNSSGETMWDYFKTNPKFFSEILDSQIPEKERSNIFKHLNSYIREEKGEKATTIKQQLADAWQKIAGSLTTTSRKKAHQEIAKAMSRTVVSTPLSSSISARNNSKSLLRTRS